MKVTFNLVDEFKLRFSDRTLTFALYKQIIDDTQDLA